MSWFAIILCVIGVAVSPFVVLAGYLFLIAPLKIRSTTPAHPKYRETTDDDLTPEMRRFMDAALQGFARAGFSEVGRLTRFDEKGKRSAVVALLRNLTTNDRAEVIGVWVENLRNLTFRIVSHFADERQVITASARLLGMYPRNPHADSVNFSWVRDAGVLAEAHRRRLVQMGREDQVRKGIDGLSDIEFFHQCETAELQRVTRAGFYQFDTTKDLYVQTVPSAYLTVWKMLPPFSKIRSAYWTRRARRLWRELKLDEAVAAVGGRNDDASIASEEARPESSRELHYHARLRFGEVEVSRSDAALTVRMGGVSRGMIVRQNVVSLVWIGGLLAFVGFVGFHWWRWYSTTRGLPPQVRVAFRPPVPGVWAWVGVVAIVADALRIAVRLSSIRGDAEVTASHAGLRFSNATGRPREGFVPRDQIEWLMPVPLVSPKNAVGLRLRYDERSIMLFVGPSADKINELRERLLEEMGIALDRQG